jgi:tetratricopeptide (TPR) repeat protein
LGDEVQVLQALGSKPWRVGMGRAIVSWPKDMPVHWKAEANANLGEPQLRGDYRYLTVNLPLPEAKDMPDDAPSRFGRATVLRVSSFNDWTELSKVMAPHFISAADVKPDGAVARQAAAIMKQSSDPLTRAALATRLVQDQVSYLLNGLDGGNYLPQHAEFTFEKRYGDCKAKSVLLLALLKQMGIDAEPALVASTGGDALPELLPVPGNFDHVIVHARIEGKDYWLDGTSAGTRLANVADVPPFFYALPIRAGGADLMPLVQRDKAQPDMMMTATLDHSAGVDFPQLFTIAIQMTGAASAPLEAMADAHDPDVLRKMAGVFTEHGDLDGGAVSSIDISYDKERAIGRIVIAGVAPPSFKWKDGKLTEDADPSVKGVHFNPDRSRPEWRDIPVATPGPGYMKMDFSITLPQQGKGFSLTGPAQQEMQFANTRITAATTLSGAKLQSVAEVRQGLGEIAPADVPEVKRQAHRLEANATKLVAPAEVTWRWDLDARQRRSRAEPILAAFDKAIAFAKEDDYGPLTQKAQFLQSIYDYDAALAAYNELIDKSPSAWSRLQRSSVLLALGRRADAIADLQASYDLEPSDDTAFTLAKELAYAGNVDDALKLLDSVPVGDDDRIGYTDARATVSGLKGDTGGALTLIKSEVADKPENSDALNTDCWFRGLFNVALDNAVAECTHAVERADNPLAALDSRALVEFRLGSDDAALDDLNAVLKLAPNIPNSRYMRGIIRLKQGDQAGREDIAKALRISPHLDEFYARHGVSPAT